MINMNVTINRGIMERNHVVVGLIYAKQEASVSINGTGIRKCNTYSMLAVQLFTSYRVVVIFHT